MKTKRIAAVTMVRNDEFFLRKWVEYYGSQLGRGNLYVFFDGTDQQVPDFCEGVNAMVVEKKPVSLSAADKSRVAIMSAQAAGLFKEGYDMVIGCDADEYIVADPATGKTLAEFLSEADIKVCASALGLDFGQKIGEEERLDPQIPFLQQRHYAQIGTRYTKAAVITRPVDWGSGFHRVRGHNFHILPNLYLLHFGYSDMALIEGRISDEDRKSQGWEKHIRKRSRTTRLVTSLKARPFDMWTRIARLCETLVRKPYAWNKPGLLGLKVIVRIPDRFRNLL